jgi:hypothetical protein
LFFSQIVISSCNSECKIVFTSHWLCNLNLAFNINKIWNLRKASTHQKRHLAKILVWNLAQCFISLQNLGVFPSTQSKKCPPCNATFLIQNPNLNNTFEPFYISLLDVNYIFKRKHHCSLQHQDVLTESYSKISKARADALKDEIDTILFREKRKLFNIYFFFIWFVILKLPWNRSGFHTVQLEREQFLSL